MAERSGETLVAVTRQHSTVSGNNVQHAQDVV
jgi:hypothetical protein